MAGVFDPYQPNMPDFLGPDPGAIVTNQRRSALAAAYAYATLYDRHLSSAWVAAMLAYHDTLPGPTGAAARALPTNIPSRAQLIAAHYNAIEDFDGASVEELVTNVQTITASEAAAVLRALGYPT